MENTDVIVESKTVEEPTIDEPTKPLEKKVLEQPEETSKTVEEETTIETVELKDEEALPASTSTDEETTRPTDEQENVTGTSATVPPTSLSPGRANVPLKEVNESEKEEPAMLSNGTDTANSKKRELEQEEERPEENGADHDDRSADQTKKMKTNEPIDTPVVENQRDGDQSCCQWDSCWCWSLTTLVWRIWLLLSKTITHFLF